MLQGHQPLRDLRLLTADTLFYNLEYSCQLKWHLDVFLDMLRCAIREILLIFLLLFVGTSTNKILKDFYFQFLCSKTSLILNQLNFAAVKFRGLPIHALFRAIKFRVFGQPRFTKVALTPLIMVRFSKFKVFWKLETESHNILRAI